MIAQWVVITSINTGFIDVFRDRVLGVNPHVVLNKFNVYFSEYDELQEDAESVEGVKNTAPFILYEMQITGENPRRRPGIAIRGVDLDKFQAMNEIDDMVVDGTLDQLAYNGELAAGPSPPEPPGLAVGTVLAEKIGVEVGDVVRLNSPLSTMRNLGTETEDSGPTWANFEIVATFNSGFYDFDSKVAVTDYRALQDIFRRGDVVTGIEIELEDPSNSEEMIASLEEVIPTYRYQLRGWPELNRNLFASLNIQKLVFAVVSGAGVVVGGFLVLCLLVIIVLEKRHEIGILRALGATKLDIVKIFVLLGLQLGLLGTALGLTLGYAVCRLIGAIHFDLAFEVYRIAELPISTRPEEFALAGLGALLICFLATFYPAYRASQISPIDAIRKR
jgi:lipoprotein-releasing system permease protein